MEIEDTFEEWEGSDIEEIEGLKGELGNEEQRGESEEESSDDEEVDEVTTVLRCKKCRKVYRKNPGLKNNKVLAKVYQNGNSIQVTRILTKCHNVKSGQGKF